MLVVLEGIDGAGKTTVARRLAAELPHVRVLGKSTVPFDHNPYLERKMGELRAVIWPPDLATRPEDDFGELYWLFLQAAWFSVVDRSLGPRANGNGEVTLFDGWWYRAVEKLAGCGRDRAWIESLFASVREPDLIVLLDVDPRLAWSRREEFKSFEIGRWSGGSEGDPRESFCRFQGALRESLLTRAREGSWHVLHQDEHTTESDVARRLRQAIHDRRATLKGDLR